MTAEVQPTSSVEVKRGSRHEAALQGRVYYANLAREALGKLVNSGQMTPRQARVEHKSLFPPQSREQSSGPEPAGVDGAGKSGQK